MDEQTVELYEDYSKFPPLEGRVLSERDIRAFFYMCLLICKADYPDFDFYG